MSFDKTMGSVSFQKLRHKEVIWSSKASQIIVHFDFFLNEPFSFHIIKTFLYTAQATRYFLIVGSCFILITLILAKT